MSCCWRMTEFFDRLALYPDPPAACAMAISTRSSSGSATHARPGRERWVLDDRIMAHPQSLCSADNVGAAAVAPRRTMGHAMGHAGPRDRPEARRDDD